MSYVFDGNLWALIAVCVAAAWLWGKLADRIFGPMDKARAERIAAQAERMVDKHAPELCGAEREDAIRLVREATAAGVKRVFLPRGERPPLWLEFEYQSEAASVVSDLSHIWGKKKEVG